MEHVDEGKMVEAYALFLREQLDALYLLDMTTVKETSPLGDSALLVTSPGDDRFAFQLSLWKKSSLADSVLEHEDPWLAEHFGSLRYGYSGHRTAYLRAKSMPIQYMPLGALIKGQWVGEAIPFWEANGVKLDWSLRGIHVPRLFSLGERLRKRRKTVWNEVRSRLHLIGMKRRFQSGKPK
jgi:hypothetical protein